MHMLRAEDANLELCTLEFSLLVMHGQLLQLMSGSGHDNVLGDNSVRGQKVHEEEEEEEEELQERVRVVRSSDFVFSTWCACLSGHTSIKWEWKSTVLS